MSRKENIVISRHGLISLALLFTALVLFHASAQGSRSASPPQKIEPGQAVVLHVWPQGLFVAFEGKAGETITLHVTSKTQEGGFDPFVRLLDPAGKEEASDDDSGGQGNCLIKDHALKKDGEYHVFIGADDNKEGEVEILLGAGFRAGAEAAAPISSPLPPPDLPERLTPDRAVTRAIWKNDLLFFFEGKAGEVITVRVTSKTRGLDPHVALLDPEAKKEATDDDSGGQGNSLIKNHALKRSGRYTVSVGTAQSDKGNVEVLLKKAKAAR
jgi:hypothetical protein